MTDYGLLKNIWKGLVTPLKDVDKVFLCINPPSPFFQYCDGFIHYTNPRGTRCMSLCHHTIIM